MLEAGQCWAGEGAEARAVGDSEGLGRGRVVLLCTWPHSESFRRNKGKERVQDRQHAGCGQEGPSSVRIPAASASKTPALTQLAFSGTFSQARQYIQHNCPLNEHRKRGEGGGEHTRTLPQARTEKGRAYLSVRQRNPDGLEELLDVGHDGAEHGGTPGTTGFL